MTRESMQIATPTLRPICSVAGMVRGTVGCMDCVDDSFVVEGGDAWMMADCEVGWIRTVVKTMIVEVDVALAESVGTVVSEIPVIQTELRVAALGMVDV
jgi:hypothetical protein